MKKCMSLLLSVLLILTLVPMVASADVTESWQTFSYSMNGPEFSVNATDFAGSDSYKFYAAAYDGTGKLIDVKSTTATLSAGNLSASVNFEQGGKEADVSIAKVKTMLWKGITPVATNGTFDVTPSVYNGETGTYNSITNGFYEAYTPTVAYSIKYSTSGAWQFNNTTSTNGGNLYDKNANTSLGWGPTTINGLMYIDLGEAKEIDRVAVVSYENNLRTAGIEFYVSTIDPWISGANRTPETAKAKFETYVDATEGVSYLGKLETAAKTATSAGARVSFAVPAAGKNSRFVLAKFQEGVCGGLVQELHAFKKKTASIPVASNRTETNVAEDAAAFAYGNSNASYAVDGSDETSWTSLNNTALNDYLILDLGAAYTISSIKATVPSDVAQNFTVYGANDAKQTDKTALTDAINTLTPATETDLGTIKSANAFRYIIFEQTAAETSFGFTEIKVNTLDGAAIGREAIGPVVPLTSATCIAEGKVDGYTGNAANKTNAQTYLLDGDPTTTVSTTGGKNPAYSCKYFFDLGEGNAKKLTHIAYQANPSSSTNWYFTDKILFVASNDSNCYKLTDATTEAQLYDVLAEMDAQPKVVTGTKSGSGDTGLLIFEVPEELQNTEYRYVGIIKIENTLDQVRLGASTLHFYTEATE